MLGTGALNTNVALARHRAAFPPVTTPDDTTEARLEIGPVLFIDIVGYSKLLTNEQRERLQELNRIVRSRSRLIFVATSAAILAFIAV